MSFLSARVPSLHLSWVSVLLLFVIGYIILPVVCCIPCVVEIIMFLYQVMV